jgi:polysaccharide biosynthesis transport protein
LRLKELRVLNAIFSLGGHHTVSEPSAEYRALQTFQKGLKVACVGATYAIEVAFESRNPVRAAQIANAIADAYAVDAFEAKFQITDQAAKWLQARLKELREQTSNSERAVLEYKSKNNIVDTGGRLMNEQQLAELNSELIQARAATAEAKARVDRVESIVASGDVNPNATATATVTDTLRNEVINKLRGSQIVGTRMKKATQRATAPATAPASRPYGPPNRSHSVTNIQMRDRVRTRSSVASITIAR